MTGHIVTALLMRATRAHMRSITEGHDSSYWAGARDALLDQAGAMVGHSRTTLREHVEALSREFLGESMDTALERLRVAEREALRQAGALA